MAFDNAQLIPLLPEIVLLCAASIVLVVDLFVTDEDRGLTYGLTLASLIATLAAVWYVAAPETQVLFDGNFIRDPMADQLKAAILVISLPVFVYSMDYLKAHRLVRGEYFTLGLFAILGMLVMVSSASFLTVYLGLELLALCLYAMVAFDRDSKQGSEAAMKYFVLGALASGMLLYGVSMIYGATGALDFVSVNAALEAGSADSTVLVFGLVFVVIGVAFKFGAVPFHMWVPDIYHGAPTAVTLFIGSTPKIAAFALTMRLLVDGLGSLHSDWQGMLVVLAVLSMVLGNVVAIAQDNIKRMLAYSTISHVGFIFLGILAGTEAGYSAAMFYAVTYAAMATGAFGILILLNRNGFEAEELYHLKGLNQRSPWFAGMMLLVMFSMAGVPPTVGFFAKLFVLDAVVRVDMTWLAVVGVAFSVIGAFYYIRIVKLMYFDSPIDETPLMLAQGTRAVLTINGLAMLFFGMFPALLIGGISVAIGG
ncbi:MAG: NADH-quinone oxidoreductase subunit NuoN [Pseudomonadota bacterium]